MLIVRTLTMEKASARRHLSAATQLRGPSSRPRGDVASASRVLVRCLEDSGGAAVEFALVLPFLLLLLFGIIQFGLTLYHFEMLTGAVRTGSRQLAIDRGAATPLTDTLNEIYGSAASLAKGNLRIILKVNGTTCATDAACGGALASGLPVTVTASYPCNLTIIGFKFAPGCVLSSSTTERAE